MIIVSAMPGPRAKQNAARKHKQKVASQDKAVTRSTSPPAIPTHVLDALKELSNDDWDKVAIILCSYPELPGMSPTSSFPRGANCPLDLTTRKGLKKVYQNFNEIYKRIDNTYAAYEGN